MWAQGIKTDDEWLNFFKLKFIFLSTPSLLYRKWIYTVFRCAPRAYSNLNIKFMQCLNINHSLLSNTSHSYQDDSLLHPIWSFYCNSTKKSIFRHFLPYMRCKKWSKKFLKQNRENRLDNFFHYIFFTAFSCILWHAILYPRTSKVLRV